MEETLDTTVPETSDVPNSEILAEYRFIITFEKYPDQPFPEGLEQEVITAVDKVLAKDFSDEVEFLFGGLVKVRVGPLERGSILGTVTLVLAGAITVAEFISKYKDFYESLVLLRSQLRAILNRVVDRVVPPHINRTTNITFVPGSVVRVVPIVQRIPPQSPIPTFNSKAFFIYLLVMNIVLTIITIALVYRAVVAMYFKTP
jgi:hypothetical protein